MENIKLTANMKSSAVIIVLTTEQSDLELDRFRKLARSVVIKVCNKLESADKKFTAVAKRKTHLPRDINTTISPTFV